MAVRTVERGRRVLFCGGGDFCFRSLVGVEEERRKGRRADVRRAWWRREEEGEGRRVVSDSGKMEGLVIFFGRETGKEAVSEIRRWWREEEDERECSGENGVRELGGGSLVEGERKRKMKNEFRVLG
ncbi:hypothetical protein HAX54_044279 [Datura stramonium]|uniref:Uncharacterized protein n=1 Tax=Datura stramonium TaxID=4076 RepID=A0ABS8SP04_DATST|nr:hypothetical protein [Datura stramonium]